MHYDAREYKMAKKILPARISKHAEAHKIINAKLSYILNEVSANGNPGLDNSLKDLYQGQKPRKETKI